MTDTKHTPTPEWRCLNCGTLSPEQKRACDCATGLLYDRNDPEKIVAAKEHYLTKPQFGTPHDEIEEKVAAWLEKNVGVTGESVMRDLANLVRGLAPEPGSDTKHRETGEVGEAMRHLLRVRQYLGDKKVPRQNIVPHVLHAIEALSAYPDLVKQNAELKAALETAISVLKDVEKCTIYDFDGDYTKPEDRLLTRLNAALSNSGAAK